MQSGSAPPAFGFSTQGTEKHCRALVYITQAEASDAGSAAIPRRRSSVPGHFVASHRIASQCIAAQRRHSDLPANSVRFRLHSEGFQRIDTVGVETLEMRSLTPRSLLLHDQDRRSR